MKVANSKLIIWTMPTSSLHEMQSINYQNIRNYDAITLCMYDVWNGAGILIF